MKVWIVTPYEPLPLFSPEVRSYRCGMLAKALLDNSHEVVFWTSTFDHFKRKEMPVEGGAGPYAAGKKLTMRYLRGKGYGQRTYIRRYVHNRMLADSFLSMAADTADTPDIIYVQIPTLELADSVITYAAARKVPVLVDIRDRWPDVYARLLPSALRPLTPYLFYPEYKRLRRILSKCAGVTAVSEDFLRWALARSEKELSESDRVFYLGYPDIALPRPSSAAALKIRADYGLSDDTFLITFGGTFCSSFDLDTVLKAAKRLAAQDAKMVAFLLAGDGEDFMRVKSMANGIPNAVLPGRVSPAELYRILSVSDAGLAPYASDALMSMPNKPFEYMSAGLPIIHSLKGELKSFANKFNLGFYYEADSPESLLNVVGSLLNHPEHAVEIGNNARNLFSSCFSDSVVYKQFVSHMEFVVKSFNN